MRESQVLRVRVKSSEAAEAKLTYIIFYRKF